jgi:hypothetical protein
MVDTAGEIKELFDEPQMTLESEIELVGADGDKKEKRRKGKK